MIDHVAHNIKSLRIFTGLNQESFAEKTGVSQSTVSNWEQCQTFPSPTNIESVIAAFPDLELSADSILSERFGFAQRAKRNGTALRIEGEMAVPLFGSTAAGKPIEMQAYDGSYPISETLYRRYPGAFLLKVEGDSMNRRVPNGAYVLINPTKEILDGAVYAICIGDNTATLKRVRIIDSGFELQPDSFNPSLVSQVFTHPSKESETVRVIGRAVAVVMPDSYVI